MLKGVPFIYQGQEFGQTAAHYDSIDCFDDIESINTYAEFCQSMPDETALEKINFGSRDNARHPMAWDGSKNSGFTDDTVETWLAPHSRATEVNVVTDLAADRSVYRFYRDLLKLRAENEAFLDGDLEVISKPEDDFFVFTRGLDGKKWVVVCNFEKKSDIKLPFECEAVTLGNLGRINISGNYAPYECAIAEVKGGM